MASDQVKDIIPRSKTSLFIVNTDTVELSVLRVMI
jgi:hypothetical protein